MPDNYKHIFISDRFEAKEFKSLSSGGKKERLYKDHTYHGNYLVSQFARNIGEDLNALPDDYWTYITVEVASIVYHNRVPPLYLNTTATNRNRRVYAFATQGKIER